MPAEGKEGTTMRNVIKNYFLEEDAIGVVEIILILVILIALVMSLANDLSYTRRTMVLYSLAL